MSRAWTHRCMTRRGTCNSAGMTPEDIQTRWLSLHAWAQDCALPAACVTMFTVMIAAGLGLRGEVLDALAGAIGAAALASALWQGMDRMTARMVHDHLLREAPRRYRDRLAHLAHPPHRSRDAIRLVEWIDADLNL